MAIRVYPEAKNPTHEISLSDGVQTWGLRLDGGPEAMQEIPMTPSTIHISGGASKFGDWEPGMAQITQQTWVGGRGLDDFSLDGSRYFDGMMAFTLIEGKFFPVPQWRFGEGQIKADNKLPGANRNQIGHDVNWVSLATDVYANQFASSSETYEMIKIQLWVRKKGSPGGNLKVELCTDSSGEPGTVLQNANVAPGEVERYGSQFIEVVITGVTQSASTVYWVVVRDANGGNAGNHWEVGTGKGSTDQAKVSSDQGINWINTNDQLYFRVRESAVNRRWRFFEYDGCTYAVDEKKGGSAAVLLMNGERGKATAGTSTTLSDSDKSWAANLWAGAWVRVLRGTGAGQKREIASNTGTQLTVSEAWDVTPDTTSVYAIYATDEWTDMSPTTGDLFDVPVKDVLVAEDVVYFARGSGNNLFKMRWNDGATPPGHEFRDDTGDAGDKLYGFSDETNEYQIYVAENENMTVTRFNPVAYGANLTGGTAISVGDDSAAITNLHDYDGNLFVFKEDGLYQIVSDKVTREDTGLDFIKSENTGEAVTNRNFFMYFSWGGFALEQLQKNAAFVDMAAVSPDRGEGLPSERRGRISFLGFHPHGLIAAVDAGETGISTVLVRTDPTGWHEIFRAPAAGWRIRAVHWQDCPGTFPRLWFDLGDEIGYQAWPRNTFNPLKDEGVVYQHECALTLADIEMGAARLPKFIKELSLISENLTTGIEVHLEYQTDKDIGSGTWLFAGTFYSSPEDTLVINEGDVRRIRLRLRLVTDVATTPPVVRATVLEGFARTPLKYQWNMRIKVGDVQRNLAGVNHDHDPDEFLTWLKDAAMGAKKVMLRSIWEPMDGKYVIVEPPSTLRTFTDPVSGEWGGAVVISVREA